MVVHWTRAGNRQALTRRALPTGDKHSTTYKEGSRETKSHPSRHAQTDQTCILRHYKTYSQVHIGKSTQVIDNADASKRETHNWQPSVPPLSSPWHANRQPHSQLAGADGDATRGPGAQISWMAYMCTETRISFLLTPPVCLALLTQPVKHI